MQRGTHDDAASVLSGCGIDETAGQRALDLNCAGRSPQPLPRRMALAFGGESGSRPRQTPAFRRLAMRARCLRARWRIAPIARAIQPASLQPRRDKPAGEKSAAAKRTEATAAQRSRHDLTRAPMERHSAAGRLRPRLHRALRAFLGPTERETCHGLFSGSEAHSRRYPQLLFALTSC